jgi:predicted nicotinamide N-methyase
MCGASRVLASDVASGLPLLEANVERNKKRFAPAADIDIVELDLCADAASHPAAVSEADVVLAADVIYDADLTCGLFCTLEAIFARVRKPVNPQVFLCFTSEVGQDTWVFDQRIDPVVGFWGACIL